MNDPLTAENRVTCQLCYGQNGAHQKGCVDYKEPPPSNPQVTLLQEIVREGGMRDSPAQWQAVKWALDEIERLTAELAEANEKQERWYEAEAKIRGVIDELGGNELFRKAIELAGANTDNPIAAERDRLRAALEKIIKRPGLQNISFSCDAQVMVDWAREALAGAAVETSAVCDCPEVCKVCGGRAAACAIMGHRPESDRHVKWHECPALNGEVAR